MFAIRYDMRCPPWSPAAPADLDAAALEQAAFVDRHQLGTLVVSEHHGAGEDDRRREVAVAGDESMSKHAAGRAPTASSPRRSVWPSSAATGR